MQRLVFNIPADTGTRNDTGPAIYGAVTQVKWSVGGTADTGGDLILSLLPLGDTGNTWAILTATDRLGVDRIWSPRQDTHDAVGVADTGTAVILAFGDKVRVTTIPGATLSGRLYVYVDDDLRRG